jgi:hypothetical protein
MTTETVDFETFVEQRFGGKLYKGAHDPNGHACVNEALNVYLGREWGDGGFDLDLRALNDARWSSDEVRTASMVTVGPVILAFQEWTPEKRQAWAKEVAEQTIRQILPPTLRRIAELI